VLLVLALIAGGVSWWYVTAGPGAYTTTPGLLALSKAEASAKATRAGFDVTIADPAYSETVPRDHVVSSDPKPGARIREGAAISLVLSRGKERYPVPDVTGLTQAKAKAAIKKARLAVGEVSETFSDTVKKGVVISSTPAEGQRLKPATAVSLVVSKGVEPIRIPDVVGKPAEAATAALTDRAFKVTSSEAYSETVARGTVISQDPRGGTAPKRSTVALVVSKGPPLVAVPNVVGKKLKDADAALRAAGFDVRVFNLPTGPDRVLDQSPNAGQQVPKGSRVTLSVF
jgi:serine/threonine-protein kinase